MTIQRDTFLLRETQAFEMFDRGASPREVAYGCGVSLRTASRLQQRWLMMPPREPSTPAPVEQPQRRPLRRCYHCGGTVLLLGDDVRCVNCGRAPLDRPRQVPLI